MGAYKKALPAKSAWIDSMESQFNSTTVPKPVDNLSAAVEADDAVFQQVAESASKALDEAAKEANAEFAKLNNLPPVMQMTNADIYRQFPELNPYSADELAGVGWDPACINNEVEISLKRKVKLLELI